jgi:hypothetical protein
MWRSTRGVVGFVLVVALAAIVVGLLVTKPTSKESASSGEAERKLQERVRVLEEIAKLEWEAFQGGQKTLVSVLEARREVLQARLDLTNDRARRAGIFVEHVELAKQLEDHVRKLNESQDTPRLDLLKATAARLRVEARWAAVQTQGEKGKR